MGASAKQVRAAVIIEALVVGVISTILAFGLGLLIAKGLFALFSAIGGSAFDKAPLRLSPRSILFAIVVGVGITFLSSLTPARKAAKIPPVATLREGVRIDPASGRRGVVGGVITGLGAAATIWGMVGVTWPVGSRIWPCSAPTGCFVLIGVAVLSPLIARPLASTIGRPIQAVYGRIGGLARSGTGRTPRRTAATATALTVGLALVTATAVMGPAR